MGSEAGGEEGFPEIAEQWMAWSAACCLLEALSTHQIRLSSQPCNACLLLESSTERKEDPEAQFPFAVKIEASYAGVGLCYRMLCLILV